SEAPKAPDPASLEASSAEDVPPAGGVVVGDPCGAEDAEHPSTVGVSTTTGPAGGTAKGDVRVQELSKLQDTVARRMSESKATAPHFYLQAEIDMSRAVEARARIKASVADGEVVPSFNDM